MLFFWLKRDAVLDVPVPDTHPAQPLPLSPHPTSQCVVLPLQGAAPPQNLHQRQHCPDISPRKASTLLLFCMHRAHPCKILIPALLIPCCQAFSLRLRCIWTGQGLAIAKKQEAASKLRVELSNQYRQRGQRPEELSLGSRGNCLSYDAIWMRPAWEEARRWPEHLSLGPSSHLFLPWGTYPCLISKASTSTAAFLEDKLVLPTSPPPWLLQASALLAFWVHLPFLDKPLT